MVIFNLEPWSVFVFVLDAPSSHIYRVYALEYQKMGSIPLELPIVFLALIPSVVDTQLYTRSLPRCRRWILQIDSKMNCSETTEYISSSHGVLILKAVSLVCILAIAVVGNTLLVLRLSGPGRRWSPPERILKFIAISGVLNALVNVTSYTVTMVSGTCSVCPCPAAVLTGVPFCQGLDIPFLSPTYIFW